MQARRPAGGGLIGDPGAKPAANSLIWPGRTPIPGQGQAALDDEAELADRDLAARQRLAERGDDGSFGLLADAVAQRHMGSPRRAKGRLELTLRTGSCKTFRATSFRRPG